MARVFLSASIKATWYGGHLMTEPITVEEVAAIGVRLLIEELGTTRARQRMRREFARYKNEYRGAGRGDGSPLSD